MRLALILLMTVGPLWAEKLDAVHVKTGWPDARGTIEFNEEGIVFRAEKPKDSRKWFWLDIQYFDRISEKEFDILTYEDQARYLGRDRSYRFRLTEGRLTDEQFRRISGKLARPVTNRVVRTPGEVSYRLPVKHQHTLGGCEGELLFTDDFIYYDSKNKKDAREWKLDRDVQNVWSRDPYRIDVAVYEGNRREFSRTRVYRFDLKRPLAPEFYRRLKLKLYDLDSTHLQ